MTSTPNHHRTQSALRKALIARARDLEIVPDTVRCPSPNAVIARRSDGSLLQLDVSTWTAKELTR